MNQDRFSVLPVPRRIDYPTRCDSAADYLGLYSSWRTRLPSLSALGPEWIPCPFRSSTAQSMTSFELVGDVGKAEGLKGIPSWPPGARIPPFECVVSGLEFLELCPVKVPAVHTDVVPLSVPSSRQIVRLKILTFGIWKVIDVVCEMNHISLSSLQCPDGMVKIPYHSPSFHTIKEAALLAGNSREEPRLPFSGEAPVVWSMFTQELWPAVITVQHRLFPESGIMAMPGYEFDHVLRINVLRTVIEHEGIPFVRSQFLGDSRNDPFSRGFRPSATPYLSTGPPEQEVEIVFVHISIT